MVLLHLPQVWRYFNFTYHENQNAACFVQYGHINNSFSLFPEEISKSITTLPCLSCALTCFNSSAVIGNFRWDKRTISPLKTKACRDQSSVSADCKGDLHVNDWPLPGRQRAALCCGHVWLVPRCLPLQGRLTLLCWETERQR